MNDKAKTINYVAIGSLVLAKVFGVLGVALAYSGMTKLGGALLILDAVMIVSAITLALVMSKVLDKQDNTEQDFLRKLMSEGRLKDQLKQIGYR